MLIFPTVYKEMACGFVISRLVENRTTQHEDIMHPQFAFATIALFFLFCSTPAFASCEADFAAGVFLTDQAEEAVEQSDWSVAADYFDRAASQFDSAAKSCTGEDARTSSKNAQTVRNNAEVARSKMRPGKSMSARDRAYADSQRAADLFKKAVALTKRDDFAAALPLFREAEKLWKGSVAGLDDEDKPKARDNAKTAAGNAGVCERKSSGKSAAQQTDQKEMDQLMTLALAELAKDKAREAEEAGDLETAKDGYSSAAEAFRKLLPGLRDPELKTMAEDSLAEAESGLQRVTGEAASPEEKLMAEMVLYAMAETIFDQAQEAYDRRDWSTALQGFNDFREAFAKLRPKMSDPDLLERGSSYDAKAKDRISECRQKMI